MHVESSYHATLLITSGAPELAITTTTRPSRRLMQVVFIVRIRWVVRVLATRIGNVVLTEKMSCDRVGSAAVSLGINILVETLDFRTGRLMAWGGVEDSSSGEQQSSIRP